MDHSRQPRNRKVLTDATHHMELLNPTCGDAIQVTMQVEDGIIQDIGFNGSGCAISIASASMMTEVMKGQPVDTAIDLSHAFNQLVGGVNEDTIQLETAEVEKLLKDANFLDGVKKFPARYKCAVLAWRALEIGLNEEVNDLEDGLTTQADA